MFRRRPPAPAAPSVAVKNSAPSPSKPSPKKPRQWQRSLLRLFFWSLLLIEIGIIGYYESTTSILQSRWLTAYAKTLNYELKPGPSKAIHYPETGPFDQRMGYSRLPTILPNLTDKGMVIAQQVEFSPALMNYVRYGLFVPYREKTSTGLDIIDCRRQLMHHFRYPKHNYARFEDIPRRIVDALLFIENRELFNTGQPLINPAIDWPRFFKAAGVNIASSIGIELPSMGGSTLATQIEKYRHSEDGRTSSILDKLQQMSSASVRVYRQGPRTLAARRDLVLSYVNTVPLSAAPGYGEVNGLGDGLYVWFMADIEHINRLLSAPESDALITQQGLAMRQIVALMIAHRRPSYYLSQNRLDLAQLTDSYLRLLGAQGYISQRLMHSALNQTLQYRNFSTNPAYFTFTLNKGVNAIRNRLAGLLEASLYDLDRMDLHADATLQTELQEQVSAYLKSLSDPEVATKAGLFGENLLSRSNQAADVQYSFTLIERTPQGNQVRVQTDNTDQPFDVNEGSKLELGSTAKVRVLTSYLEIIAEIYDRYTLTTPLTTNPGTETSAATPQETEDRLTQWVLDYLQKNPGHSLSQLLDAALLRKYSSAAGEVFFTGGGQHIFSNFSKSNARLPTVREALRQSINLPFIRMLRDIVQYTEHQSHENLPQLLKDDQDPRRQAIVDRFIDRESLVFLTRFWNKYQHKTPEERLNSFITGLKPTGKRLAAIHRYVYPQADLATFTAFLKEYWSEFASQGDRETLEQLYNNYGPGRFDLHDQGYIARVHPLELWLLAYMQQNPQARYADIVKASVEPRYQVYRWLLRSKAKTARNSRVRTILEIEAFTDIHRRWKRLGYPFDHLVPSLATALGSSGDRPAALAELFGIIQNDGKRLPTIRFTQLHFGRDTPYETLVDNTQKPAEQVMKPEVARALKSALAEVVERGTAKRLSGVYTDENKKPLAVGGKTGTGDNRLVSRGQKTVALNRTATFAFYLGEHHFGTLTAFIPGAEAKNFKFTSALPVQVLKSMAPILRPYLQEGSQCALNTTQNTAQN